MVKENWLIDFTGDPFTEFAARMRKAKKALAQWSKETFGDVFKRVVDLEAQIQIKEA